MTSPAFDLNQHTARLLLDEPFFAALSRRMDKRVMTSIPTAGVRLNEDTARYELLYNPQWFIDCMARRRALGFEGEEVYKWVKGTLVHEFMHICFGHVDGRLPEDGMSMDWNVAGDLAINTHLMGRDGDHQLPPECCFPGEGPFAEFPAGLSAEAYYKMIRDQKQDEGEEGEDGQPSQGDQGEGEGSGGSGEGSDEPSEGSEGQGEGEGEGEGEGSGEGSGGSGEGSFDDHSGWGGEGNEQAREIARERMKEDIRAAAEEADKSNSWGSVPSSCRREIREMVRTFVDWRSVMRYFVRTTVKADKRSTVRRLNRRYPFIHSGKKVTRFARIAVSIDQSGSVSDSMLAAFYSELNKLSKLVEFTVVPFDDQVFKDGIHVWKKGQRNEKTRYCCGGTNFDAPTTYVNEQGFDGHIVLTDMYAPKPVRSRCPRIWMTDRDGASQPYFKTNERVIAIEDRA